MEPNEAIKYLFKTLSAYKERCNSEWCDKDKEALDVLTKELEKQKKYKWHNLRKNPDDYPKDYQMYLLELATDEPIIKHVIWRGDMIRPNTEDDVHILAWKEIEDFEEEDTE